MIDKNICNICGGNYVPKNGRWVCEACGAFKPEEINNEELTLIYRAEEEIRCTNFEDAEDTFSHIIELYPEDSEGYWGYLRAHYGIKYERDYNGKTIPSCYNACYESFLQHPYYQKALQKADSKQKIYYEREAARIDAIREEWIEKAEQEPEYDVFLSYKDSESGPEGNKTDDYNKVYEIYNHLTSLGYHVFFAPKSLSGKAGEKNYEPYIFRALNTAHVMIVYASKPEYLNATWVKNEWSRFLKRIERGEKAQNALAVAFSGFNASELPRPLNTIQNFDASAFSFAPELERYVEGVVSQARMTMPRISRISLSSRSMPKAKTLNGTKLQKVGLSSVQKSKEKIIKATVESRKFGLETTPTLTGDVSNRLIVADEYVKRRQFQEAKDILDPILANDKWNGRALLLKMLADSNSTSIGTFVKQIDTFQDFPLLESVINYGERSVSEDLLQKIAAAILNLFNTGEYETSLRLYKQIASYDSPTLFSLHKAIVKQAITLLGNYRENVFEHLDLGLLYLRVDEHEFKIQLKNVITTLLANEDFTDAGKYLIEYKESFGEDRFYLVQDFLKNSAAPTFEKALAAPNDLMAERLTKTMESMTKTGANSLLRNIANSCSILFKNNDFETASFWVNFLKPYEFSKRSEFQKEGIEYLTNNISPDNYTLFKLLLSYYGTGQEEAFLCAYENYANRLKDHHYYAAAIEAYTDLLEYNPKSEAVLYSRILAICKCQAPENLKDNIGQLAIKNDFGPIEAYLTVDGDKDSFLRRLSELSSTALAGFVGESSVNALKVFERLSSYYPKSEDSKLADEFEQIAQVSQKRNLYDIAVKYYSLAIGLGKDGHETYWRLLQSKLHCKDDEELVVCKTPIASFPEFNNAIVAAGKNRPVIEKYIDCSIKQRRYLETQKRKQKNRKVFVAVSAVAAGVLLVFCMVFSLAVKVFIPNSKYENAVSLINNREYYQAYEQLKGFDYADSSSQLSIAKAGMAFDRGDYEEGIDCMYNVGGVTNINYDGNGGKAPASSQTVKKFKNWVNNDPLYAGYSFYGWVIDSFSIKTRKNSYLCNLNLKATWKLVNYSISYALNGSTLENKVETYNCLSRDFSLGQPQKKGYTFDGWSGTDLSEITKDVVVPQGSIGDRAYEAHFTAKSYNVTYDYGYDNVTSKATATYDSQFNVKSPSRDGYDFIGWTYNGEEFASKTWNIDSDITLIAHWKAKKYKISYDLNGGDNSPANLNEYTIETPTFTLSDPTKSGYDFVGWSGAGISGVSKDVAIEKGSIGNREYTANWKAHTYIVNLDSNGGECSTSKMNVDYNEKFVLPRPTKMGYTFAGWFNAEDNAEVTDCTWKFLFDLNLYAKWNINTYTITYVLGGGVNDENNPIAYNVESDDITLNNPTRSGYTFAGWNSKLGNKQFNPTISQGSVGDLSFEATWEANLNAIVFIGNGYTGGDTKSQQAYTGSKLKLNANGYIRDGYTFIGWSESPGGTVKYSDQGEITVPVNSIYNLYAVWTPNLNTITFNGNGADSGTMDAQRMRTDTTENLATNGFAKTGYHFAGWSANPMGEVKYADEGAYQMGPNPSYDLYAKWEPNEYVITYNPNSGIASKNSDKVIFDNQFILIVPTRDGYEFSGWYIGETQLTDSRGGSLAKYGIAGNITVVAHWKPNLNVVLTIVDGTTTRSYGETDSFIRLPKISRTKENNIFVGWSNTVDGDVLYKNEDLYKIGPKSSYTLYGIWKDVSSYQSISNCDDLKNIKQNGKYYLTNDIDCKDVQWSPLFDFDTPFVGEIYGCGHYINNVDMANFSISNYYKKFNGDMNQYGNFLLSKYYAYTGLFCKVGTGAVISDVNIRATISGRFCGLTVGSYWSDGRGVGSYNFGGICGLNKGTINGCTTSLYFDNPILAGKQEGVGTTHSTANIGGIAGTNNGTISNCFSYLSGTKFTTEGVDSTDYYGTAIFNGSEYTTYDESSNSISSSKGETASLNLDGKTPVVVLIDGEVDSIYWIDNYEPFLMSKISSPSKYGYTLTGWKYKEHVYSLNEYIYPEYGSSILIEPVFSPNDTSLVLNANNGKESENKEILIKTGESIALNQYKNGITVPYGYYFAGWSSIQGNTAEYDSDAIFKSDGNSKILYAVWLPNKNSIVFNNNGGEGNMPNQSIFTNETISLATCTLNAPKGYYFAGWSSSPDGEVEYNDCSNITSNGESVINLYAIWKPID